MDRISATGGHLWSSYNGQIAMRTFVSYILRPRRGDTVFKYAGEADGIKFYPVVGSDPDADFNDTGIQEVKS